MEMYNASLKNYTTLRIGGNAQMIDVTSTGELIEALMHVRAEGLFMCILGKGTNIFFAEKMENLLVIKMSIKGISLEEHDDYVVITSYAGEAWDDIVTFAVKKNLWGIENLSYIPGTVGAAPVQNIGAYGAELSDVFVSLSALDTNTLNIVEINSAGCDFGYRSSLFKKEIGRYVIISVPMKLSKKRAPKLTYRPLDSLKQKQDVTLQEIRDMVIETRTAKLPDYNTYPNAGSFFKNPIIDKERAKIITEQYPAIQLVEHGDYYKIPAAWLIEHVAEYKGIRTRNVGTWPNQPLVIVNYGSANAQELLTFSEVIITKIKEKTGIVLEREVNFVQ
jgi:UDP-N-acetylmuramate dehydrogenase